MKEEIIIRSIEFFNENGGGSRLISSMFFYEVIYPLLKNVIEGETVNKKEIQEIMEEISKLNLKPYLVKRLVIFIISKLSEKIESLEKNENQKLEILKNYLITFAKKDLNNNLNIDKISNYAEEFYKEEQIFSLAAAEEKEQFDTVEKYMPFYFVDETLGVSAIGDIKFNYTYSNNKDNIYLININKDYIKEFNKFEDRLYIYYLDTEEVIPLIYKGEFLNSFNSFYLEKNLYTEGKPILVHIKGGTWADNLKSFFEGIKQLKR